MKFKEGKVYKIKNKAPLKQGKGACVTKKLKFLMEYESFYLFLHKKGYRETFLKASENIDWEGNG